ncbi:MAG: PstS family phosphate ABC transporter substrate-binding protein [Gammaproteobacteria bacterium]|nr:PstS family phosphate ABC transporter substrate-binding protein [Gammaproteobacteria bacterium]
MSRIPRVLALTAAAALSALVPGTASAQSARDFITIVGSSTVYPFTTTVAEQFGRQGRFKTPKVESTGTGGGVKLFCNGVGPQFPDIVNASRRMNASEFDTCRKNGVKDIVEVRVGYDGLTIAESKRGPVLNVTRKQVYLALAKQIPDPANPTVLIPNPYTTWNQIDKSLPATKIEVLGPPPTSGTRDSFHELYMEAGCRTYPWLNTLRGQDEKRFKRICHTMREDGAFIEAGENDNLIVQKIEANRSAVGIFGFSFLEENLDQLRGSKIDGIEPTFETIASGKYPASRPLFIYVKKAHIGVIPGLLEFVNEYVSDKALGEEGYLADRGLVPQPKSDLARTRADVKSLKNFAP